ncbi:GNAT family N-acetyltransferase [Georgenia faecalis]|uniref:GNAT family N-acetyltransferase n=1 Tax=Georgenia faecalis TaxID=2483799 RepID=UPI0013DE818B|nr:GNAT family N-acetyltransferase [Georgenia faecalis]
MDTTAPVPTASVRIAPVPASEREAAAALAARAMRNNPMHVAALGPNGRRRVDVMHRAFTAMLADRPVLGAWQGERLVGVAAHTASPRCQPDARQLVRLMPTVAQARTSTPRLLRWLATWGRHDPATPHSHLGPVAVDPRFRGRGIGSALLGRYVKDLDDGGAPGYLETDRLANVRLYRRFGFEVVHQAGVLGVPNWFMVRPPGRQRP